MVYVCHSFVDLAYLCAWFFVCLFLHFLAFISDLVLCEIGCRSKRILLLSFVVCWLGWTLYASAAECGKVSIKFRGHSVCGFSTPVLETT